MKFNRKILLLIILGILGITVACNLPVFATPEPFVFPTPDMTMTALFAPTLVPPTNTAVPDTATPNPTETPYRQRRRQILHPQQHPRKQQFLQLQYRLLTGPVPA